MFENVFKLLKKKKKNCTFLIQGGGGGPQILYYDWTNFCIPFRKSFANENPTRRES